MPDFSYEYKGLIIEWSEGAKGWQAKDGNDWLGKALPSQHETEALIDKHLKVQTQRIPVYVSNYNEFADGEISSAADTQSYDHQPQYWVQSEGKRRKYSKNELYSQTPENTAIVAEIRAKAIQVKILSKEIDNLRKGLKTI